MKLVGVICSQETRCQIMVQNVTELEPKSVNRTQIEDGEVHRKVYSGFNTVFLSLLLLAAGVGFPAACFWR